MFALAVGHIDKRMYEYVAITLHWLFLNALSWINMICFELVGLVKHEYTTAHQSLSKKCFKSLILAVLAPSLIVSILIFLSRYESLWVGYGQSLGYSLMTNQTAVYLTILVPFVGTNVVSIGILTAIVVKLHLHRASVNRSGITTANGQSSINVAKTAMKLVALFGIAELLGVIQTKQPAVDDVFSTLYVFFRSSRGVLICLYYICNDNDRRLLKGKFKRQQLNLTEVAVSKNIIDQYSSMTEK